MSNKKAMLIEVHAYADNNWPGFVGSDVGEITKIACSPDGMTDGKPSVSVLVTLPDGRRVLGQTGLDLLLTAIEAFVLAHGDPRRSE